MAYGTADDMAKSADEMAGNGMLTDKGMAGLEG